MVDSKPDIENRSNLELLVKTFYERLLQDQEFSYIFIEVAKINVLHHIDIIVDFWESALFQAQVYKRNTLRKHLDLHIKYPLKKSHFDAWLSIFNQTVDDLFDGINANNAKTRALSISTVIQLKIANLDHSIL